jgi:hypothetical protein
VRDWIVIAALAYGLCIMAIVVYQAVTFGQDDDD